MFCLEGYISVFDVLDFLSNDFSDSYDTTEAIRLPAPGIFFGG
jgi:hypothetical protein